MDKNKILIVDDEEDIRIFLRYNLEKAGYEVKTATDGEDALRIIELEDFDLIIADIMMPKLNGLGMFKLIEQKTDKSIPVIFLTASNDELHYISALLAGCYDFLNKPIPLSQLKRRIADVFSTSKFGATG